MIDYKRIEFLKDCVSLGNDSWTDMVERLISLYQGNHGLISRELAIELEKELLGQIEWAEEHCKIVTRTETREVTFRELEVDDI